MKTSRYSRQKEIIFNALTRTKEHPTAEMLYEWLKPENPHLSLGTVYRNLNRLVCEGDIIRLNFPVERYDANVQPHPHMKCLQCGRGIDIPIPYDARLNDQASDLTGHEIYGHELVFSGVCFQCKNKIKINN